MKSVTLLAAFFLCALGLFLTPFSASALPVTAAITKQITSPARLRGESGSVLVEMTTILSKYAGLKFATIQMPPGVALVHFRQTEMNVEGANRRQRFQFRLSVRGRCNLDGAYKARFLFYCEPKNPAEVNACRTYQNRPHDIPFTLRSENLCGESVINAR